MSLSFTIATGPRQRSHSQVRLRRDSWPYFTVSDSRLPQPGGPDPRIYIPAEQGYTPRYWVSSCPTTSRATVEVFDPASTRYEWLASEFRVRVTLRLEVYCQSVRLADKPLETHDQNFYFTTEHLRLVLMWHTLWGEDGSVVYNCCWSSPAQSFSGLSSQLEADSMFC
jgi:hypothetical protein